MNLFTPKLQALLDIARTGDSQEALHELIEDDFIVSHLDSKRGYRFGLRPNGRKALARALRELTAATSSTLTRRYS